MNKILFILLQSETGQSILLQNERLNSVVAVLLVIFLGIALYIFGAQRKITKLENRIKNLEEK